jgi:hypothetical protein
MTLADFHFEHVSLLRDLRFIKVKNKNLGYFQDVPSFTACVCGVFEVEFTRRIVCDQFWISNSNSNIQTENDLLLGGTKLSIP